MKFAVSWCLLIGAGAILLLSSAGCGKTDARSADAFYLFLQDECGQVGPQRPVTPELVGAVDGFGACWWPRSVLSLSGGV